MRLVVTVVPIVLISCAISFAVVEADEPEFRAHPAYRLLERLLQPPGQVTVQQFSSHNKKGLNGDENWPLYEDEHGDSVIFDAAGPGCVRSIWGTNFDSDSVIKFYFDEDSEPRYSINYVDFFRGQHPLFPPPLVSYDRRGHWGTKPFAGNSFVPIPFEKALKIAVSGNSRFFHVLWERYPYPNPVKSFTGKEDHSALADGFERFGGELFDASDLDTVMVDTEIVEPGQEVSLLKIEEGVGIVRRIVIEGDGSRGFFQNTWLRMRWDGHERWDVYAPTGIFFGAAVEADESRSLPLSVEILEGGRVRLTGYFPMPFWK